MSKPFNIIKNAGIILTPLYFVLAYTGVLALILSEQQTDIVFKYVLYCSLALFTLGIFNENVNLTTASKNKVDFNRYTNIVGGISLLLFSIVYILGFVI